MQRMLIAIGLVAALALPAGALAKPTDGHKRAAIAQCKAERGKTRLTREAFKAKYHSFSRCVRKDAAEEKAQSEEAHTNAAKECKAEREADPAAFQAKYGTNHNKRNAFGKCVSAKAKENKAEMDAEDKQDAEDFKNAAKECGAERKTLGDDAFEAKYGTNHNKRNAFGKCVSSKSHDDDGSDEKGKDESPDDS
jgi:hypothetical protein